MKTVQIQELKRHLSALVDEAEAGEQIVVTRHNRVVAWLVPPPHEGLHTGSRFGAGRLSPLESLGPCGPIAQTLAEDRAQER